MYLLSLACPQISFRCSHDFCFRAIQNVCRPLNIDEAVTLLYQHQCNSQAEACIQLVKCTIMKCRQTDNNEHFALLHIRSISVSAGLPSSAMMLFNRPISAPLLQIIREPINVNNDNEYYNALKSRQEACTRYNDTLQRLTLFFSGSTVVVQMEDGDHWTHGMIIEGNSKDH